MALSPRESGWLDSLPPFDADVNRFAEVVRLASVRAGRRDMTMTEAWNRGALVYQRYGRYGALADQFTPRERALITDTVNLLRSLTDADRHHFGVLMGGCRLHALVFGQNERPGAHSAALQRWIDDGMSTQNDEKGG